MIDVLGLMVLCAHGFLLQTFAALWWRTVSGDGETLTIGIPQNSQFLKFGES